MAAIQPVLIFIAFNLVMPVLDLSLDLANGVDLIDQDRPKWGALSILIMFFPMLGKIIMTMYSWCKGDKNPFEIDDTKEQNLCDLLKRVHFPFLLPFVNLKRLIFLMQNQRNSANDQECEKVKKKTALDGQFEALFESFPQLLLQMLIVAKTGEITKIQLLSMISSTISLSYTACNAFYTQREEQFADPEPDFHMIWIVFPYFFLMLLSILTQYLIMTAFWQFSIFLAVPIILFSTYFYILTKEKCGNGRAVVESDNENQLNAESEFDVEKKQKDFNLQAALTSLSLPCVVGRHEKVRLCTLFTAKELEFATF